MPACADPLAPYRERDEWGAPVTVHGQGHCLRPVQHMMYAADTTTGEVEPVVLSTACGNRRHTVCPYCSSLYARDAWQVIRSGMLDASKPLTCVTLTAPGMAVPGDTLLDHDRGCPHYQAVDASYKSGKPHKHAAGCEADEGAPIDPDQFDYDRAASWNAASSLLWDDFMERLRAKRYRRLRDQRVAAPLARRASAVAFVRVSESQRRGLLHHHVALRGAHDEEMIRECWREARAYLDGYVHRYSDHEEYGCKVEIKPAHDLEGRRKTCNYLTKYLTKSITCTTDHDAPEGLRAKHYARLRESVARQAAARSPLCKLGQWIEVAYANVWVDGRPHRCECNQCDQARRYRRRAAEMLGFTGHVFSKSSAHGKRWGKTLGDCREERRAWMRDNGDAPPSLVWEWEALIGTGYGYDAASQAARIVAELLAADAWGRPPPAWLLELASS